MKTLFHEGDKVRVTRNVRNDGTFPGKEIGDILIKRGCEGHVQSIGTFLQDQIIYSVHFLENNQMIGCREEELMDAHDEWLPSRFEFRDKVVSSKALSINGKVIVALGEQGEIVKVLNEAPGVFNYHVRFPGKTLLVPEGALDSEIAVAKEEEVLE